MYCMIHNQNPVHYSKFRNIHAYSCPIHTYSGHIIAYSESFLTLAYSEPWYIYNLEYIQNSVKAYSGIFR